MNADRKEISEEAAESGDELDSYLSKVLRRTLRGEIGANVSADVILPDQQDLAIRLVSLHSLERLRDAEADKAVYDNLLWCLMGGLLGFFTNVATGGRGVDSTGVYVCWAHIIDSFRRIVDASPSVTTS